MTRRTAIFDLGGVVLSWDPVRAFSAEVDTAEARRLMSDVDFTTWNRRNDAGRRFADGEAEVADTWPEYADAITAYRRHFDRTLTGTVPGTSAIVVSGQEKIAKPDPRLYRLLLDRYHVDAGSAVFVDDSQANCAAAADLGVRAIRFSDADSLRERLVRAGFLGAHRPVSQSLFHVTERAVWQAQVSLR